MNHLEISISALTIALLISSCKKDDVDAKGGQLSGGILTATVDGQSWAAGKIEKKENTPSGGSASAQFNAYSSANSSLFVFFFLPDAEQREYVVGTDFELSMTYQQDIKQLSTSEDATEGKMTITKYTTDSLVATFDFKTATHAITNGKVKIKHN